MICAGEKRTADLKAALQIDGWLTPPEADCLYDLARNSRGPIIEIGSWRGRSTACLALGSMAGQHQPVYTVDAFVGVPVDDRPTAAGVNPGPNSNTPDMLRANLDAAGVNGLVTIIAKPSGQAADDLPNDCAVLFVDGGHDYPTVSDDLRRYLPKVRVGGMVLIHDVLPTDPGVVAAVDEQLMGRPEEWRPMGRFDSAVAFQRGAQVKHEVLLAVPGRGFAWGMVEALQQVSRVHGVRMANNSNGFDDMNVLWAQAMNMYDAGEITHFAMLHSDIAPMALWLDVLLTEMDDREAALVSTAVPIKDNRGLTSSGVGVHSNPWGAFRRFTVRELSDLPPTFGLSDTPHDQPGKYLIHNTGCMVCDLRCPAFREVDVEGCLKVWLGFPTRVGKHAGRWVHVRESEDWFFSRKLAEAKPLPPSFITRKVQVKHMGEFAFPNSGDWGSYAHDQETKERWSDAV